MTQRLPLIAALLMALCAAPALAQEQAKPDSIVLEAKAGSVMTSTGGDYTSAQTGKQLVEGESLMLNDGAKATVVYYYDNGKRKCTEHYAGPNTYVIDDSCKAAGWIATNPRGTVLIVGGAIAAAAILGSGGGDNNAPPVSAGAR